MRTRVKICGLTRDEDARAAIAAGADALGFVFWPDSPRAVTAGLAAAIAPDVGVVARVGVFVNQDPDEIARTVRDARLNAVQLHGDERVEDFVRCGAPVIKAVTIESDDDVTRALAYPGHVTLLVDAGDRARRGGTGVVANWDFARRVAAVRPVMLAGGLNAGNIAEAIRRVRPWAIDVSSGVETSPGRKSAERIVALCQAVADADREEQ